MPETEVKDLEENKIELKSGDEVITLNAHKEETKKFWLKEIKQYITDVVALQEHSLDDLKIDPKQHLESIEPTIKLPQRIEAYEPNQNIKPSDFAEDYTVSKYSTVKATEEIKTKTVGSVKESTTVTEHVSTVKTESSQVTHIQESTEVKAQKVTPIKEPSKIPVFKKSEQKVEEKPAEPVNAEVPKKPPQAVKVVKVEAVEKPKEAPKVEEKIKEVEPPKVTPKPIEEKSVEKVVEKSAGKVEVKPITLPELKTEIVRKTPVDLQSVASQQIEKPPVKEVEVKEAKAPEAPVKSELSEVEASVSEKLDRLSQKLRALRKTETDKEVTKFVPQEKVQTEVEKSEEELRKQEAIREAIQEKLDDDYISESSVIKRIEERYKRNYKDKDIKISSRKSSVAEEAEKVEAVKVEAVKVEEVKVEAKKPAAPKVDEVKLQAETKPQKPKPEPLKLSKDEKPAEKQPKITKAADSNTSDSSNQQPQQPDQSQDNSGDNQSGSAQDNSDRGSSSSQNNQSGDSRRPNKEPSPPSPGAIRLPGFFDPPPPTQYETSIEVHVKKEKYPDPPPKITRKVVVKNEELERKTEEFLRGELPYEKEEYTVTSAQRKIKNLKHNIGKTGDTIKFAEDTVSKARVGDFKHIKTPGTVVPVGKKEPVFEYQYTVEDPKTGLCITTSEAVDFEDAEEELKKLAAMDAENQNKTITKRVEGMRVNNFSFLQQLRTILIRIFFDWKDNFIRKTFLIFLIISRLFV